MAYLERLLYKNKQQHRASQHFQRLQEVMFSHRNIIAVSTATLTRFRRSSENPVAWQVRKYLQLWKKLQIPSLLGELSATSTAGGNAGDGIAGQTASSLGLLTVQRLIAGEPVMCLLLGIARRPMRSGANAQHEGCAPWVQGVS